MKKPFQQNEALINDIAHTRALCDGGFRLWWLGQSGFLIQYNTRHLILDPYLSDSLTLKYANTDKPHTRMTERVIEPALLDFIDVVTSSHNHTDHLDAETLKPLMRTNPEISIIVPKANARFVANRLGVGVWKLMSADIGTINCSGFMFTSIPAAHNAIERDENGCHKFLGFVIRIGQFNVYHSGDTLLFPELVEEVRSCGPIDIALLPINGDRPERRVAGNLNGKDAANLAKDVNAKLVIPCHYDMFEFNTANPADEFIPQCERIGQKYRVLQQGERWSSDELK